MALSPQQQWISSLPDRRSVRTLPQSAPDATCLSCLQLIMRHDLLFLLFYILHLTLPHAALPPTRPLVPVVFSSLRLTAYLTLFHLFVGWGGGLAGRKEGCKHMDIWAVSETTGTQPAARHAQFRQWTKTGCMSRK